MRNDGVQSAGNTVVRNARLLVALVTLLVGCGCGSSGPSSASPTAMYAGTWTGRVIGAVAPDGVLQLTISQSGDTLTGAWALTSSSPDHISSGNMSGAIVGGAMSVVLRPPTRPGAPCRSPAI